MLPHSPHGHATDTTTHTTTTALVADAARHGTTSTLCAWSQHPPLPAGYPHTHSLTHQHVEGAHAKGVCVRGVAVVQRHLCACQLSLSYAAALLALHQEPGKEAPESSCCPNAPCCCQSCSGVMSSPSALVVHTVLHAPFISSASPYEM